MHIFASLVFITAFYMSSSDRVSSNSMPDSLQHSMTFRGQKVDLRLTKCKHTNSDVPLVVVGHGRSIREFNFDETYAAYNDVSNKVSLIARLNKYKNNSVEFMQGLFVRNAKLFTLAPAGPEERTNPSSNMAIGDQTMRFQEEQAAVYFKDAVLKLNNTNNPKQRNKRQSFLGTFTIESLIVTDYSVYSRFYALSKRSSAAERNIGAQSSLIYYYINIANGVNQRYASITGRDFAMNVRLVGIYISTDPGSSPFTENNFFKYVSRGETYLDSLMVYSSFKQWITQFAIVNGRFFDQATMFTNYKMHIGFSNGQPIIVTGIAHIGSMCDISNRTGVESTSTSLNVDRGIFASIGTMAHEIGHNLNSQHDGEGNACVFRDQFVMAAGPGPLDSSNFNNIFRFSPCSPEYMSTLLRNFNARQTTNCLASLSGPNYSPPIDQRLPGIRYNLTEQCQIINGPNSFYCGGDHQDPCALMQCYNPSGQLCLTLNDVRAFEGSLCGNKKWCVQGRCVFDNQAPAAPMGAETCLYGDYWNAFGVANNPNFQCNQIVPGSAFVSQCYDANYTYARCCASCERVRQVNPPNCPFGDRDPNYCLSGTKERCYELAFNTTCCRTCALFRQNKTGCEYGDRYPTTCNVGASSCYQVEASCCEACSKFLEPAANDCRYGDRVTWCASTSNLEDLCPREPLNCCKTCRNVRNATTTALPGCRDQSTQYCSNIQQSQCYASSTSTFCCSTCGRLNTGVKGCEYGNQAPWCGNVVTSASSCSDANVLGNCCQSCAQYTGVTFPTTTRAPDLCRDTDASYCSSRRPTECYSSSLRSYCCSTCNRLRVGPAGCEYGNKADWCTGYVTGASSCVDSNVVQSCCQSCAQYANSIPTTTPQPSCRDQAFWCSTIFSGQCYDPTTENTCCSTCSRLRRNNQPSCRYGDRYAWCAPQYCNTDKNSCCSTCTGSLSEILTSNGNESRINKIAFILIICTLFYAR